MSSVLRPLVGLMLMSVLAACGQATTTPATQAEAVSVQDGWIRETPPGAKVSAGYMRLVNATSQAAHLRSVNVAQAERAEIHTMFMQDGMMRMRQLENGLEIPARGQAELKAGAEHLMLMGLNSALTPDMQIRVELTFADGSSQVVDLPVRSATGKSGHAHH